MKIAAGAVVFGVSITLCAAAGIEAKALPKTAELVPAETALLVETDDFGLLRRQFEKTTLNGLWKEPAMSGFVEKLRSKWSERFAGKQDDLLATILGLEIMPSGRLAFALVLDEQSKDADEPPILVISQWAGDVDKIREQVEKVTEKLADRGVHISRADYRDVTIVTTTEEQKPVEVKDWENFDPDKGPVGTKTVQRPPLKTSYCFIDDCLIVSAKAELIKFVVAHIEGASGPALAGDVDYTTAMGAVGPNHDIDIYVNIKQLVKTVGQEDDTSRMQASLTSMGFDNVSGIGCSVAVAREPGSSWAGKMFVKINGAKRGICKMLDLVSAPVRAPRFVPPSAYSVMFVNIDIKKAYDELYNVISKISPASAAAMNTPLLPASPDGAAAIELKSGVIDYLGSQVVIAQSIKKPFESHKMPTETLFAVGLRDRAGLERSLSLLHSRFVGSEDPDARRELLGHTIYILKLPNLPFFGAGARPMQIARLQGQKGPAMAFTVTDSHLIIASEPSVEQAIRMLSGTKTTSLGSAGWFSAARAAMPSVAGVAVFEDSAASTELLWWMLKQSAESSGVVGMGPTGYMLGAAGIGDWADFTLLPEFDAVRKYFGSSVMYGVSRADGFFFESKYLNRIQPPGR